MTPGTCKVVELIIPAAFALLGVLLGGWITARNQSKERQHNRVREQLQGFYAPLYGIRAQIREKAAFLQKISKATEETFERLSVAPAGAREDSHFDYVQNRIPAFGKAVDENNRQAKEVILPLYRLMLEHFSSHIGLAEPSTFEHFGALVEFVETWERWATGTVPYEVVKELAPSDEKLQPLYRDLEEQLNRLRKLMKS